MTVTKEEFFNMLEWQKKAKAGGGTNAEVSVTVNKDKLGEKITFIFRTEAVKNFKTGFLAFAIFKNRILFKDDKDGYKIIGYKNYSNRYVRVTALTQKLKYFEGDYKLKYDDFYDVYYIEKEEK